MSSVGAAEADHLSGLAAEHGVTLFDAPVSGSTDPGEQGKLTIRASGPPQERGPVEPVLAVEMRVLDAVLRQMEAVAQRHGDEDLAAVYELDLRRV